MSGDASGVEGMGEVLTTFGEALGKMRQRLVSGGAPEAVADQILTDFSREIARSISTRMGFSLRSPRLPGSGN